MKLGLGNLAQQNRRGAAATEFAFVLPLMVMLALGCVDFGRFAYYYIAVQNASRCGAEYAIMTPYLSKTKSAWDAAVQQKARDEMTNQTGYDSTKLTTVASTVVEASGLRRVTVTATYNSFQTLVTWPGIPSSTKLSVPVVMRVIR